MNFLSAGDVLSLSQRAAFRRYIETGGGFVGVHGAGGDPVYVWDWYADVLLGARFIGHPSNPQFQEAQVRIDAGIPALAEGLGEGWKMVEEWYSFAASPRGSGAHIVASLDETTYDPGRANLRMGADHPIAWARCIGKGLAFYTAIGHRPENYRHPQSVRLLENGIAWAARVNPGQAGCEGGTAVGG